MTDTIRLIRVSDAIYSYHRPPTSPNATAWDYHVVGERVVVARAIRQDHAIGVRAVFNLLDGLPSPVAVCKLEAAWYALP